MSLLAASILTAAIFLAFGIVAFVIGASRRSRAADDEAALIERTLMNGEG